MIVTKILPNVLYIPIEKVEDDNTFEIAQKYRNMYPDGIFYILKNEIVQLINENELV